MFLFLISIEMSLLKERINLFFNPEFLQHDKNVCYLVMSQVSKICNKCSRTLLSIQCLKQSRTKYLQLHI